MIKVLSYIILAIVWTIATPLAIIGYVANFLWALTYFGWSKADKHQAIIVAIYEKRNQSNGEKTDAASK